MNRVFVPLTQLLNFVILATSKRQSDTADAGQIEKLNKLRDFPPFDIEVHDTMTGPAK